MTDLGVLTQAMLKFGILNEGLLRKKMAHKKQKSRVTDFGSLTQKSMKFGILMVAHRGTHMTE